MAAHVVLARNPFEPSSPRFRLEYYETMRDMLPDTERACLTHFTQGDDGAIDLGKIIRVGKLLGAGARGAVYLGCIRATPSLQDQLCRLWGDSENISMDFAIKVQYSDEASVEEIEFTKRASKLLEFGITPNVPIVFRAYDCPDCLMTVGSKLSRLERRPRITSGRELENCARLSDLWLDQDRDTLDLDDYEPFVYRPAETMNLARQAIKHRSTGGKIETVIDRVLDMPCEQSCSIMLTELSSGDGLQWIESPHSDGEWMSMFFQIMNAIMALQSLEITHDDVALRNLLYNEVQAENWEYEIFGVRYVVPTEGMLWKLADYGMAQSTTGPFVDMRELLRDVLLTPGRRLSPAVTAWGKAAETLIKVEMERQRFQEDSSQTAERSWFRRIFSDEMMPPGVSFTRPPQPPGSEPVVRRMRRFVQSDQAFQNILDFEMDESRKRRHSPDPIVDCKMSATK